MILQELQETFALTAVPSVSGGERGLNIVIFLSVINPSNLFVHSSAATYSFSVMEFGLKKTIIS